MENTNFSSLTEKLILDGIIPSDNNEQNLFETKPDNIIPNSNPIADFQDNPSEISKNKKRLNKDDFEYVKETSHDFLALNSEIKNKNIFEKIFYKLFPKLYEAKLAKNAVTKLFELGIDEKALFDKRIPYGESDSRYKNLVKYLNYANELQSRLKK